MGRKKIPENKKKKHETFRANQETVEWLISFGGTKQRGFDLLIEYGKKHIRLNDKNTNGE